MSSGSDVECCVIVAHRKRSRSVSPGDSELAVKRQRIVDCELADSESLILMDPRLHTACAVNDVEQVKQLIEEGTDPTLPDNDGNSVFHLVCASSVCTLQVLQYLSGVVYGSVDASRVNTLRNTYRSTPLHLTCYAGRVDCVRYLSRYPHFLDAVCSHDEQANTPLYYAISRGYESVVRLFTAHEEGYWLRNMEESDVRTCTTLAVDQKHTGIVELLWKSGNLKVVQHLVSVAGCNVNAQDKYGRTALYCASIQ